MSFFNEATKEVMAPVWGKDFEKKWKDFAEDIKNALWHEAKSWTVGWLKPGQLPDGFQGRAIEERNDYVEIRVRSMHIPYESVGLRRFYGTVHSFIGLDTLTAGRATFNTVTTPTQLQNIDRTNLMNVITEDVLLLGPVPYQGGDINLEAGVFSVLANNLLAPFLKIIEDISKTAGVSVVSQAIPFVGPIENAIYNLIGYSSENRLEIGINMPLIGGEIKEGYLVAVGAPKDTNLLSNLKLHEDGTLYDTKGEIKKFPYMVLSVKAKKRRGSYNIPEIKTATANLITACGTGDIDVILKFYKAYENAINGCPDLLPEDSRMVIDEIYSKKVKPILDNARKKKEQDQEGPSGGIPIGPTGLAAGLELQISKTQESRTKIKALEEADQFLTSLER